MISCILSCIFLIAHGTYFLVLHFTIRFYNLEQNTPMSFSYVKSQKERRRHCMMYLIISLVIYVRAQKKFGPLILILPVYDS